MDVRRCELSCYGAARSVYGNLLKQSGNVGGRRIGDLLQHGTKLQMMQNDEGNVE